MPRVEQTRKPCPSCGGPLELHIETTTEGDEEDGIMSTAKVLRLLVCPACGYRREEEPVSP